MKKQNTSIPVLPGGPMTFGQNQYITGPLVRPAHVKKAKTSSGRKRTRAKLTPSQRAANARKAAEIAKKMRSLRKKNPSEYKRQQLSRMRKIKKYASKDEATLLSLLAKKKANRKAARQTRANAAREAQVAGLANLLRPSFTDYGAVAVPRNFYQGHNFAEGLFKGDDYEPIEELVPFYSRNTMVNFAEDKLTPGQIAAGDRRAQFRYLYKKHGGDITKFGTLRRKKGDPPRVRPMTKNTRITPKSWEYKKSKLPTSTQIKNWYSGHYLGIPENKRHANTKVKANAKLRAQIRFMRAHPDAIYNLKRIERVKTTRPKKSNRVLANLAALNNAGVNDLSPVF